MYVLCFNSFTTPKIIHTHYPKNLYHVPFNLLLFCPYHQSVLSNIYPTMKNKAFADPLYNPIQAKCPHQSPTSLSKSRHSAINGHSGHFIHIPNPLFCTISTSHGHCMTTLSAPPCINFIHCLISTLSSLQPCIDPTGR